MSSINKECQQQNDVENMERESEEGGRRLSKVGIMNNYKRATIQCSGEAFGALLSNGIAICVQSTQLTRTGHEDTAQRDLSDSLLCSIDRVAIDDAIIITHWNAVLKLSGKSLLAGGKRIDFSIKISLHGKDDNRHCDTNCILIKGMLTQFAAATAASGTSLGRSPVAFYARIFYQIGDSK
jgi:hypothetical protein